MGALQLLSLWNLTRRPTEIAQQVAKRCQREVLQQVVGHTVGMSAPERRGYIRARSATIVQRESDVALAKNRQLRAADRVAVVELATDAVVAAVYSATVTPRQKKAA